jgi:hypothetical protein
MNRRSACVTLSATTLFPSPGIPAFGSEAQARRGEGQGGGFTSQSVFGKRHAPQQSVLSIARMAFVGLLAALVTGCASLSDVDLVASGAVKADRVDSELIDLSLPSVHREGDVLVVTGTVMRRPGVDGPIPEPLQILFLSDNGAVLDELWPTWQPDEIPIDGNRQSSYEVRYAWLPPNGTIVRAVYGSRPAGLPSGGRASARGNGLSQTQTRNTPNHQHRIGRSGIFRSRGRR